MKDMTKLWILLVSLTLSLTAGACQSSKTASQSPDDSPRAEAEGAEEGKHAQEAEGAEQHQKPARKPGAGDADAMKTFHQMDGRKPVPLTPMMANHQRANMRDHLVAIQEIVEAAADEDFDGVEEAAQKIGSSPKMKQMCNHMGAGAEGFTEKALGFHETADGIIEAAEEKDYDGVMGSLGETLGTCTSCHAQYKQQIVPDEVWRQKTGMGAPSGDMHQKHHGGGHH